MSETKNIGHELRVLTNLIKRNIDRYMAVKSPPEVNETTDVHGYIIGYLLRHAGEDVFQRDIEQHFNIRRSTVTGILQCMEKNGCITREPVDYDARLKKIILTDKAVAMHKNITAALTATKETLVKGIADEELECFFDVVEKMKNNLLQE